MAKGDVIFWMLAMVAVAADLALLWVAFHMARRKVGPFARLGVEYKVAFATCGCALLPFLFVGAGIVTYFGTLVVGAIHFKVAEDAPTTPPPSEFVGLWKGDDKSLLLISEDGIASYRNGKHPIDLSTREKIIEAYAPPEHTFIWTLDLPTPTWS